MEVFKKLPSAIQFVITLIIINFFKIFVAHKLNSVPKSCIQYPNPIFKKPFNFGGVKIKC